MALEYSLKMWPRIVLTSGMILALILCTGGAKEGKKPKFSKDVFSFTVNAGRVARLKCEVVNSTGVTFKWYRKGKLMSTKPTGRFRIRKGISDLLRITATQRNDAGLYTCVAKNKYGSIKRTLNLTVEGFGPTLGKPGEGPPWFTKPSNAKILYLAWPASNDAKLKCEADGQPPLKYQWLKDGKPLLHRRLDPNLNTKRWFLKIKTAVLSDQGMYTCIVSNKFGNISQKFHLKVVEKGRTKPILSKNFPKNHTVRTGSNLTLECRELFTVSLTDYRWIRWYKVPPNYTKLEFKDGAETNSSKYFLYDPKYYSSFKDGTEYGVRLMLTNLTKKDSGMYSCLVSNHIGADSRSGFVTIDDSVHPIDTGNPRGYTTFPVDERKLSGMQQGSVIAIMLLCIVIVLTVISVIVFMVCYKRKMSRKMEVRAKYSRTTMGDPNCSKNDQLTMFDGVTGGVKGLTSMFLRQGGRLESSSSTSSTLPMLFSRQSSIRSRIPSNGGAKIDSDISEGEIELPFDEEWEIDERQLSIKEQLGEGAFGLVMKAEAFDLPGYPKCHTVAVKMLKHDATELELQDLVSEMETMKRIGSHKNIINLIGCCTQNGVSFLYVVVEYAPYGNLRQFLRERRPSTHNTKPRKNDDDQTETNPPCITMRDFISFAFQISRGMGHLSAKKCIHRDLAARNILVGEDYVMKIADFGLARHARDMDYYRKTTDGRLPVKWLAIEALFDRVYTIQSDVWAFGVLLWEIFTLGGSPYPGIPVEKLFELLKSGYRMEKPQACPLQVYEIMLQTWSENPTYRPSFTELEEHFEKMLSNLTSQEYVDIVDNSLNTLASSESDSASNNSENNDVHRFTNNAFV